MGVVDDMKVTVLRDLHRYHAAMVDGDTRTLDSILDA